MAAPRRRSWRSSPTTRTPLSREEAQALERAIIREPEPGFLKLLCEYLEAGKSPRRILDALQIASAQVILETQGAEQFLVAAALLRVSELDDLVLRQFRA